MKAATKKFLDLYLSIDSETEKIEDLYKFERKTQEKKVAKMNADLEKLNSKISEEEFNNHLASLMCCEYEDFKI